MAGLLDFYGDSQANLALAAGLLSGGNFGQALARGMAGAQAVMTAEDERKRRNEYMQAQAENLRSEIAKRQYDMEKASRLQALIDRATGGGQQGASPVPGDAYLPGASPVAGPRGNMAGLFAPETLAALKLQGVDLVDVAKLAKPEWQNINGNLVNTNDPGFKGGFQPGMATSANGQVTMWQPDGAGGLVVGAPRGAIDTYRAYQGAGKQAENDNTLAPLDRIDPATGRPYSATTGQLVRNVQGQGAQQPANVASAGYNGGNRDAANAESLRILQSELAQARAKNDIQTAQALEREIGRIKMQSPSLSAQQPPAAPGGFNGFAGPADIEKAVGQVKADIQPTQQRTAAMASATYLNDLLDKAIKHQGRETATGMSGLIDPRNYLPGTSAKDYQALHDQIGGNVFLRAFADLKGGGQITEKEGVKAEAALARMNRAQSDGEYLAALKEFQGVVQGGIARMGGQVPQGGAKPARTPVAQGLYNGRKVIKYSDGSTDYAD